MTTSLKNNFAANTNSDTPDKEDDAKRYMCKNTYDEEMNGYGTTKYGDCVCKNCKFFKQTNFKKLFFCGILVPVVWLFPIIAYMWKYIIVDVEDKIDIELPTSFELAQYDRKRLVKLRVKEKDVNFINKSDYQPVATDGANQMHGSGNECLKTAHQGCVEEIFHRVYASHDDLKRSVEIWAFRCLTAFFTYLVIVLMVVLCAVVSSGEGRYFYI